MLKSKTLFLALATLLLSTGAYSQQAGNNNIINRIFVIMFENEDLSLVMQDSNFSSIASSGTLLTNYYGVTHPSQPNYIASISGGLCGFTGDDCNDIPADSLNLVDLLEPANVSWKAYMEDLPVNNKKTCYAGNYYRKHNPFISFKSNQVPNRLSQIVNASTLSTDLANNTVPAFCWYTPNIQNDGHTPPPPCAQDSSGGSLCNIAYAGNWLRSFINTLGANQQFMDSTLIVITFDECFPKNPNTQVPIYTVLLGPSSLITPGTTFNNCDGAVNTQVCNLNHYNLLATIEKNFNLGNLGRYDAISMPFSFLWENAVSLKRKHK